MHEHDRLETDDVCLHLHGQRFGRLGLEIWNSCESN